MPVLIATNPKTNTDVYLNCDPPKSGWNESEIKKLPPIPTDLSDDVFEKTFIQKMTSLGARKIEVTSIRDYGAIVPVAPWLELLDQKPKPPK